MKVKTTQKTIKALKPICFWYCEIQNLLRYENPIFYTCGQLGRKADTYNIDGIRIETGYNTTGNINEIPYKTTQVYEKKAQEIWRQEGITYEERKEKHRKLLKEMITISNIYRSYIKESITYKELENFLGEKLNETIKKED